MHENMLKMILCLNWCNCRSTKKVLHKLIAFLYLLFDVELRSGNFFNRSYPIHEFFYMKESNILRSITYILTILTRQCRLCR